MRESIDGDRVGDMVGLCAKCVLGALKMLVEDQGFVSAVMRIEGRNNKVCCSGSGSSMTRPSQAR
jgi:hypothetical protein